MVCGERDLWRGGNIEEADSGLERRVPEESASTPDHFGGKERMPRDDNGQTLSQTLPIQLANVAQAEEKRHWPAPTVIEEHVLFPGRERQPAFF
jgi:hypothetical protein